MTEKQALDQLEDVLRGTAKIASSVQGKVGLFALIGLIATLLMAWLFYSVESSLVWNITKCGLVSLPAIVVGSAWLTLGKVVAAPNQIAELTDGGGFVDNLQLLGIKKPDSVRGLISTVRAIRNEDGLGGITEAIGGIVLLSNPVYLLFVFISIVILSLLIIVAPFVLLF